MKPANANQQKRPPAGGSGQALRRNSGQALRRNSGQALVVLLMFVTVAMMVAVSATLLSSYALSATTRAEVSQLAVDVSESGMENALLRLLRDPDYPGETLTLPDGVATITVTGGSTKTITSKGQVGNHIHSIVSTVTYSNGIYTLTSWTDSF